MDPILSIRLITALSAGDLLKFYMHYNTSSSWFIVEIFSRPLPHGPFLSFMTTVCFSGSQPSMILSVKKPFSTQQNTSPAIYWVNEALNSPSPVGILKWVMHDKGIRNVDPAGNLMISLASSKTRWPPCMWSNLPREVMVHQPKARFSILQCLCAQTCRPQYAKTLLLKLHFLSICL